MTKKNNGKKIFGEYSIKAFTIPVVIIVAIIHISIILLIININHSSNNLYHLMSNECPEEWSETTYREFHLAHYHSEKVKDVGGVIYRWLPTVCGTDDYHYDKGYVGSVKRSYSFLYALCLLPQRLRLMWLSLKLGPMALQKKRFLYQTVSI